MSLLDRVKQSLKKKDSEDSENVEVLEDAEDKQELEESPDFEESFNFYEKKWVIAPFMNEIRAGDLEKIPIECMFSHYILFSIDFHCYYIGLQNHENGDEFEIYEFDWVGEAEDPEFKEKQITNFSGYHVFVMKKYELESLLRYINDILNGIPGNIPWKQKGLLLSQYFYWENFKETIENI
jgi:hypothetical protein